MGKFRSVALLVLSLCPLHARGDQDTFLIVEPKLGYASGSYEAISQDSLSGFVAGLYSGVQVKHVSFGIDAEYANLRTNSGEVGNRVAAFGRLGFNGSVLRVWAAGGGGVLFSFTDPSSTVSADYGCYGWRAGAGLLLFKSISLNAEYVDLRSSQKDGIERPGAAEHVRMTGAVFSISFPLYLEFKGFLSPAGFPPPTVQPPPLFP